MLTGTLSLLELPSLGSPAYLGRPAGSWQPRMSSICCKQFASAHHYATTLPCNASLADDAASQGSSVPACNGLSTTSRLPVLSCYAGASTGHLCSALPSQVSHVGVIAIAIPVGACLRVQVARAGICALGGAPSACPVCKLDHQRLSWRHLYAMTGFSEPHPSHSIQHLSPLQHSFSTDSCVPSQNRTIAVENALARCSMHPHTACADSSPVRCPCAKV